MGGTALQREKRKWAAMIAFFPDSPSALYLFLPSLLMLSAIVSCSERSNRRPALLFTGLNVDVDSSNAALKFEQMNGSKRQKEVLSLTPSIEVNRVRQVVTEEILFLFLFFTRTRTPATGMPFVCYLFLLHQVTSFLFSFFPDSSSHSLSSRVYLLPLTFCSDRC